MPLDISLVVSIPAPLPSHGQGGDRGGLELTVGPDGKVLIHSQNNIVLISGAFFKELDREYLLVLVNKSHEWAQYGPMTRIFSHFSRTLSFGDSAHVGYYPQPSVIPRTFANERLKVPDMQRASCTPDSAGIWISTDCSDAAVTSWMYWWCEDKPLIKAKHVQCIEQWEIGSTERRVSIVDEFIRQINMQARYVFLCYNKPPRGRTSHPGFFAFLTIGYRFTLFRYRQPDDWSALVEKAKDRKDLESIPLQPEVVLFDEPILNNEHDGFSDQMLYAFELLRRHMEPVYVQPSFYQPHTDLDKPMEDEVKTVANSDVLYTLPPNWLELEPNILLCRLQTMIP
ncbi:hypothetical protein BDY19DRAFT_994836 [Irpex rosettiformis]|uniref:Uncharacterized protein n=1 Tax=Irpex rosettiformis TaxID=378272 RepID=A0ACB8TZR3_9APHY|nr:hypothetical protein BDY19DRAFT_994836 [Irpex rosettiformis]